MKRLLFVLFTLFILPLSFCIQHSRAAGPVLPQTGQTTCYGANGVAIDCVDTGQAGDQQTGVSWPSPRFTDNANGTITDNLTGLIWLKDANCFGSASWANAISLANTLANGQCGLIDSSTAGQWRLPNVRELHSLINEQHANSATWLNSQGLSNVLASYYWSSTTFSGDVAQAWIVDMSAGKILIKPKTNYQVWPVRDGQ